MNSLPTWAMWSIIAAAVLSPVLAFLMAIAVEIFIGVLKMLAFSNSSPLAPLGPLAGCCFASCGSGRAEVPQSKREQRAEARSG
jgi:phosphate/sulfate permease